VALVLSGQRKTFIWLKTAGIPESSQILVQKERRVREERALLFSSSACCPQACLGTVAVALRSSIFTPRGVGTSLLWSTGNLLSLAVP